MARKNKKVHSGLWNGFLVSLAWLGGRMRSGAARLGINGALLLAIFVAMVAGVWLAGRFAGSLPTFRVYPARFKASAPPWCARDLETITFPRESYSIFDPALTRDVANAYLASPWVRAVRAVRKRFPNRISVELVLRQPLAFVRVGNTYRAVDNEAVHLPLEFSLWPHRRRPLPIVFGAEGRPPVPGATWREPHVAAAVEVLNALAAEPAVFREVQFVDVSNLDGKIAPLQSEVMLMTRRRVRVAWGRPPGTPKFGEPPVAWKLARLRQWLTHPVQLSEGTHLDLRFPDTQTLVQR